MFDALFSSIGSSLSGLFDNVVAGITKSFANFSLESIAKKIGENLVNSAVNAVTNAAVGAIVNSKAFQKVNGVLDKLSGYGIGLGINLNQVVYDAVGTTVGTIATNIAPGLTKGGMSGGSVINIAKIGGAQVTFNTSIFVDAVTRSYASISPTQKLFSSNFGSTFGLQYPLELGDYYMCMYFEKYNRSSINKPVTHNINGSIFLPLPANLQEAIGVRYNDVPLGALGGELADAASEIANVYRQASDSLADQAAGAADKLYDTVVNPGTLGLLMRRAAGVNDALKATVDQIAGNTPNPHLSVALAGIDLRNFRFMWRFSPNTPKESDAVRDIIRMLKFKALPGLSPSRLYLEYPDTVRVLLKTGGTPNKIGDLTTDKDNYLFVFKRAVISNVEVNYAASGTPSFFGGTKAPTDIELAISLREIEYLTQQTIIDEATRGK